VTSCSTVSFDVPVAVTRTVIGYVPQFAWYVPSDSSAAPVIRPVEPFRVTPLGR